MLDDSSPCIQLNDLYRAACPYQPPSRPLCQTPSFRSTSFSSSTLLADLHAAGAASGLALQTPSLPTRIALLSRGHYNDVEQVVFPSRSVTPTSESIFDPRNSIVLGCAGGLTVLDGSVSGDRRHCEVSEGLRVRIVRETT